MAKHLFRVNFTQNNAATDDYSNGSSVGDYGISIEGLHLESQPLAEPAGQVTCKDKAHGVFKVKVKLPDCSTEEMCIRQTESFGISDTEVSKYIQVHTIDVPFTHETKGCIYGRDAITEWGDTLFVKESLLNNKQFIELMERLGYGKNIELSEFLSEGGRYIIGKEFVFIPKLYEWIWDILEPELRKHVGDIPVYFMPSITSFGREHIDCDYQVVDKAKLIYVGSVLYNNKREDCRFACNKLEEIARMHDYDLREYKLPVDCKLLVKDDALTYTEELVDFIRIHNGINSIVDDDLMLTGFIHPDEKAFLEQRGMKVVEVPVGMLDPGAGLRCVYGEFSIS